VGFSGDSGIRVRFNAPADRPASLELFPEIVIAGLDRLA
jgi:hypothetical protein